MYNKIIVAVDFSDASSLVLEKALQLAGKEADKLQLVHVVEPIPAVWGMESYAIDPIELQDKIRDSAAKLLSELGDTVGISGDQQHTLLGSPAERIRELQAELNADAIVIGSHGYSGWKLMLGSTANKLLHGAKVDVLTVHLPKANS